MSSSSGGKNRHIVSLHRIRHDNYYSYRAMIIIATTPPQAPPITVPFSRARVCVFVVSTAKRQKHFKTIYQNRRRPISNQMLISGNDNCYWSDWLMAIYKHTFDYHNIKQFTTGLVTLRKFSTKQHITYNICLTWSGAHYVTLVWLVDDSAYSRMKLNGCLNRKPMVLTLHTEKPSGQHATRHTKDSKAVTHWVQEPHIHMWPNIATPITIVRSKRPKN